jgi:hypothetical protein
MQICKPYGSVKHLVYLFHTQGAQTGQPKGYCFVEYSSRQVHKLSLCIVILNSDHWLVSCRRLIMHVVV